VNILIVDDHSIVRLGLKEVLADAFPGVELGEAETSGEALAQSAKQAWDAVILDVNLPDGNGLDVLKILKQTRPTMPVLMLSFHPDGQYAQQALHGGPMPMCPKAAPSRY